MRTTLVNGHPTIIRKRSGSMGPDGITTMLEGVFDDLLTPRPWLNPIWWRRFGRATRHMDGCFGATQSILTSRHEITNDQMLDRENARVPANALKTRIAGRGSSHSISILGMDPSFGLYRPSVTSPREPLLRLVADVLRILRWMQDHPDEDVTLVTKGLANIQSEENGTPVVQIASPYSPTVLRERGPDMIVQPEAGTLRCLDVNILRTGEWTGVHISPTVLETGAHPIDIMSGMRQVERLLVDSR